MLTIIYDFYFPCLQLGENELKDAFILVFANKQDQPLSVGEVQTALGLSGLKADRGGVRVPCV